MQVEVRGLDAAGKQEMTSFEMAVGQRRSRDKAERTRLSSRHISRWNYPHAGITPMLQLIRAILKVPEDPTQCFLLFANQVSLLFSVPAL